MALDGGSVGDWQRFIGEGAWDDGLIRAQHLRMVAESLGQDDGVLIVDGTELPCWRRSSIACGPMTNVFPVRW